MTQLKKYWQILAQISWQIMSTCWSRNGSDEEKWNNVVNYVKVILNDNRISSRILHPTSMLLLSSRWTENSHQSKSWAKSFHLIPEKESFQWWKFLGSSRLTWARFSHEECQSIGRNLSSSQSSDSISLHVSEATKIWIRLPGTHCRVIDLIIEWKKVIKIE